MKVKRFLLASIGLVVVGFTLFGFILPALFSAASTEAVLLGVFIVAVLVYFTGMFIAKKVSDLRDEDESEL